MQHFKFLNWLIGEFVVFDVTNRLFQTKFHGMKFQTSKALAYLLNVSVFLLCKFHVLDKTEMVQYIIRWIYIKTK